VPRTIRRITSFCDHAAHIHHLVREMVDAMTDLSLRTRRLKEIFNAHWLATTLTRYERLLDLACRRVPRKPQLALRILNRCQREARRFTHG
jgi:hypothetical protein